MQHKCQNCGELWERRELAPVKDVDLRVEQGEELPSGECRGCGGLCRPIDPEKEFLLVYLFGDVLKSITLSAQRLHPFPYFNLPERAIKWTASWSCDVGASWDGGDFVLVRVK